MKKQYVAPEANVALLAFSENIASWSQKQTPDSWWWTQSGVKFWGETGNAASAPNAQWVYDATDGEFKKD